TAEEAAGSGVTAGSIESPDFGGGLRKPGLILAAAAGLLVLGGLVAYAMSGSEDPAPPPITEAERPKAIVASKPEPKQTSEPSNSELADEANEPTETIQAGDAREADKKKAEDDSASTPV